MIPLFKVAMAPDAHEHVARVLASGHIAQGPEVDIFEAELAFVMRLGTDCKIVAVNSGTTAIHMALMLAGVRPDDDVAVSPITCAATIAPIVHLGARPLWIDVDPKTGLMDPGSLNWRLTSKTSAIIAIDWAGTPCDYAAIHEAAGGIPVIEDAAHAMLARLPDGLPLGTLCDSHSHYVCHSLQAIKHLTTGDGGILITPPDQIERARRMRWFGLDRTKPREQHEIDEVGGKWHMNDIAAAIGRANMQLLPNTLMRHKANAKRYCDAFGSLAERGLAQSWNPGSSWWMYTLIIDGDRGEFIKHMAEWGVEVSQVHRRNDQQPAFRRAAGWQRELPGVDLFASRQINIPCGSWLSDVDVDHVIEAVSRWCKRG